MTALVAIGSGSYGWWTSDPFPLPFAASAAGATTALQVLFYDPASANGFAVTNALRLVLGFAW